MTCRLVDVAAGRMNLLFTEENHERSLGRRKQEFGFIHVRFGIPTGHPRGMSRRHLGKRV